MGDGNGKRVVGRPWPKGVSGNPAGRPPGIGRLGTALREIEDMPCPQSLLETLRDHPVMKLLPKGATVAQVIAAVTLVRALNGDKTALPLTYHYSDGLPKQSIEIDGNLNTLTPLTLEEVVARVKAARNGGNGNQG